ncbi:MAG: DUF1295 domain-containing protein [Deltaproteobacteria bacterium]
MTKNAGGLRVLIAYVAAIVAAVVAGWLARAMHPWWIVAIADVAGTAVIFGFSRAYDNSSFYDAYWSVAPPLIGAYFVWEAGASPRLLLALVLVTAWAVRLTFNWWRRWDGLTHEDWRYVDLRDQTGRMYWAVSWLGLHLFPTVLVYLGCLPLWAAAESEVVLGVVDAVAVVVMGGAITIEAIADRQLFAHVAEGGGGVLDRGLWRWSRHPNYFGELALWWGVALFGVASGSREWFVFAGAVAMTGLFVFISIPMVERRSLARRGDAFRAYSARTSMLIPWPPKERDREA